MTDAEHGVSGATFQLTMDYPKWDRKVIFSQMKFKVLIPFESV